MSRPRARLIAVLVAVSAIAAATTANAGPEHDRLTAMCGTWDVERTFWFQSEPFRIWRMASSVDH